MNIEALFLFLILLLGLLLCSFLGGNYQKEGFSSSSKTYYGPNGSSATISTDSGDVKTITVNESSGPSTILLTESPNNNNSFINNFGYTATISNGNIIINSPNNGPVMTFSLENNNENSNSNSSTTSNSTSTPSNYDNYNHFTGSETSPQLQNGMVFVDKSGNSITVITNSNGTQSLQLNSAGQSTPMVLNSTPPTSNTPIQANTFYGPFGNNTATVYTDNNNQTAIKVNIGGNVMIFTLSNNGYNNPDMTSSTQYFGSTGYHIQSSPYSTSFDGANGGQAGSITGPNGNTAYYATGPNGNGIAGINTNQYNGPNNQDYGNTYSSTMSQGIPASQIQPGQEDLYILKSEIVPPVCPVCPTSSACPRQEPCPPCPACARCPEPAFECKKVPNYNAISEEYLPQPVLNDFSQFGM